MADLRGIVAREAANRVGQFVQYIGRVTAAEVVRAEPITNAVRATGLEVTERITVTSRVPHGVA